jgi:RNA polymerase sigma-70 factor (ECF subfamily)
VGLSGRSTSWEDCTDLELVRAATEDLDAFGELIRRHQDFVYGAAMRVVRNPSIAEELAQDTFLRAFRALDGFRGDSQVRSWLYRIATNLAKNAVTRRKEYPTDQGLDLPVHIHPTARLETHAMSVDLRAAIDRLPDKLREPLVLREFEELSYEEIAEKTDTPLNTVRTRILRARRALRTDMEEWR